ncbi:MAG: hypothetical protein KJ822_19830, partial [Proteobacteria bacterium]|nr:hypothetical protein [Pseudomonadota bacterium]
VRPLQRLFDPVGHRALLSETGQFQREGKTRQPQGGVLKSSRSLAASMISNFRAAAFRIACGGVAENFPLNILSVSLHRPLIAISAAKFINESLKIAV